MRRLLTQHMVVPNGRNARLMGTTHLNPFRRSGGGGVPSLLDTALGIYDFTDASTLWTDDGITQVANDGDLIFRADDISGNGRHWRQPTAAARPTYRTGGGPSYAEFDGVDDKMVLAENTRNLASIVASYELNAASVAYDTLLDNVTTPDSNTIRLNNTGSGWRGVSGGTGTGTEYVGNTDNTFVNQVQTTTVTKEVAELCRWVGFPTGFSGGAIRGVGVLGHSVGTRYFHGKVYCIVFTDIVGSPEQIDELETFVGGKTGVQYNANGFTPSVIADFAGLKGRPFYLDNEGNNTFDAMFTFLRVGEATYVGSDGLLKTAADGVPRNDAYFYDGATLVKGGILFEAEAATNLDLAPNDFSGWDATNTTVAKNQTGASGSANEAHLVTATANGGTFTEQITRVANTTIWGCYMKRVSGTGTIEVTCNNGTTWTDVTSQLVTSNFVRVQTPTGYSVLNPVYGIRFGTSGDAVAMQSSQIETSTVLHSFTPTTKAVETLSIAGSKMDANTTGMSFAIRGYMNTPNLVNAAAINTFFQWRISTNDYIMIFPDTDRGTGGLNYRVKKSGANNNIESSGNLFSENNPVEPFASAMWVSPTALNGATFGLSETEIPLAGIPGLSSREFQFGLFSDFVSPFNGYITEFLQWGDVIEDAGIEEATAPPPFNPLDLFVGGRTGYWLDASDLSTLYQTDDTSTPVTAALDDVGRWEAKGPGGQVFSQTATGRLGTYRLDSATGKHYISFNGFSDYLDLVGNIVNAAETYLGFAGGSATNVNDVIIGRSSDSVSIRAASNVLLRCAVEGNSDANDYTHTGGETEIDGVSTGVTIIDQPQVGRFKGYSLSTEKSGFDRLGAGLTDRCWNGSLWQVFVFSTPLNETEKARLLTWIEEAIGVPQPTPSLVTWPVGDAGSADFNDGALDDGWSFVSGTDDPTWDKFALNNNQLTWAYAVGEGADPGTGATNAGQAVPRIERDMPVGDFDVHVMLAAMPHKYNDGNYRGYGFCIYEGGGNSSRWDIYTQNDSTSRGAKTFCTSGAGSIAFNDPVPPGSGDTGYPMHLHISRVGDLWNMNVSYDGVNFQNVANATLAGFAPTKLGFFAYQIGDSGFPFQATIDYVHIGAQKLPFLSDEGNRTTLWQPTFDDLSEVTDESKNGGTLSVASNELTLITPAVDGATTRFSANSVPIPADCGVLMRYAQVTSSDASSIFIGAQLRANAWRGVDWTNVYGPPLGWVSEFNPGNDLQRVLTINGDEPVSTDGAYWNFIASDNVEDMTNWTWQRMEVIGPIYRQRTWKDGQSEPTTWDFEIVDNSVPDAGEFGVAWGKNIGNAATSGEMKFASIEVYEISADTFGSTQITGSYDLTIASNQNRVGMTSQFGLINPATTPAGFTISRLFARRANANVTLRIQNYTGTYEGDINIDFGIGPDAQLTYDGNGSWSGVSPAFLNFLETNDGSTVPIFMGGD